MSGWGNDRRSVSPQGRGGSGGHGDDRRGGYGGRSGGYDDRRGGGGYDDRRGGGGGGRDYDDRRGGYRGGRRDSRDDYRGGGRGGGYSGGASYDSYRGGYRGDDGGYRGRRDDYRDRRDPRGGYSSNPPREERVGDAIVGNGTKSYRNNVQADCTVFVGNLPFRATPRDLKELLDPAGKIKFVDIMLTHEGRSRGCGIVAYETPEEAQRAIADIHNTPYEGRPLLVREDHAPAPRSFGGGRDGPDSRRSGGYDDRDRGRRGSDSRPRSRFQFVPERTVIITNLPSNAAWQELKDFARSAGEVEKCDVMDVSSGPDTKIGVVKFRHSDDAQRAIRDMDGQDWKGSNLQARIAVPEDENMLRGDSSSGVDHDMNGKGATESKTAIYVSGV